MGTEAQEWVSFVVGGFYCFFTSSTIGWRANGIGFLCCRILLLSTTTDAEVQVGFFEFVEGFIFLVHDYWVGSQGDRFLLSRDFLMYTTTGPRGDGVGFMCPGINLLRGGEVGSGVSFVRLGRVAGVGRPGAGWWTFFTQGPRFMGGDMERLTYYLVSCR